MTKDEAVDAWKKGCPVVDTDPLNGDILYLRISALIYRQASTDELNRGYPRRYLQVELEPMNNANTRTITIPSALRFPTVEELSSPGSYRETPREVPRKIKPSVYMTPEARQQIMTAENRDPQMPF